MKVGPWGLWAAIACSGLGCEPGSQPAAVTSAPGGTLASIGASPSASASATGGTHWDRLSDPGIDARAFGFVDETSGWVVGSRNRILRTGDGGQTWSPPRALPAVPRPDEVVLTGVSFVDARTGYVAGSAGVFRTEDGGNRWTAVDLPAGAPASASGAEATRPDVCFHDALSGVIVDGGGLHRTLDGGRTWKTTAAAPPVRELGMIGTGFGVLTDQALLRSNETGGWEPVALPSPSATGTRAQVARSFSFLDPKDGWVLVGDGALYRTFDGGSRWTRQPGSVGEGRLVRFIDGAHGWVVGPGTFKATTKGGISWTDVTGVGGELTRDMPQAIAVVDTLHVWLLDGTGAVWRFAP